MVLKGLNCVHNGKIRSNGLVLCESEQFFLNYQFKELGIKSGGFLMKSSDFT